MRFKVYHVKRIGLFDLLARFDFQLLEAGELFVTASISNSMAGEILSIYPDSIWPL